MTYSMNVLGTQASNDPRGLVALAESKSDYIYDGLNSALTQELFSVNFPAGTAGHCDIVLYNASGVEVFRRRKAQGSSFVQLRLYSGAIEGAHAGDPDGWDVSTTNFGPGAKISLVVSGKMGAGVQVASNHTPAQPSSYTCSLTGNGYVEIDVPVFVNSL